MSIESLPPLRGGVKSQQSPNLGEIFKTYARSVLPSSDLDYTMLVAMRGAEDGNGALDHACPLCGPQHSEQGQQRTVLRTWRPDRDTIGYHCVRCEAKGVARASDPPRTSPLPEWIPPPVKAKTDESLIASQEYAEYVAWLYYSATTELPAKVRAYFKWRGIPIGDAPVGALRYQPKCPFGKSGKIPCIVARYTDAVTGEGRGIWRRPPIVGRNAAKPMTLGSMKGCVIRLWPQEMVGKRLVLGEGVETTLAAALCVPYYGHKLQPAWAAGSAGNIKRFPVLKGIEQLILLVDNDVSGTGQAAADECERRWVAAGRSVIRLMPKKVGTDFNDWVISCRH